MPLSQKITFFMQVKFFPSSEFNIAKVDESKTGNVRAHIHESLMEGHNWFLNQFVQITKRSVIVCFLSLLEKAGLSL